MQFINVQIGDRMEIVDVSKDSRGGVTLYEACWSQDPKVRAIGPSAAEAVTKVKERILAARTPRSARILLVEDDPGAADLAKYICEMDGHEVMTAKNGVEAMVKLGTHPFDLILTDLDMPALDGFTLAKRITGLPVIAVTATRRKLDDLDVAAKVVKPYTPEVLRHAVRQALS